MVFVTSFRKASADHGGSNIISRGTKQIIVIVIIEYFSKIYFYLLCFEKNLPIYLVVISSFSTHWKCSKKKLLFEVCITGSTLSLSGYPVIRPARYPAYEIGYQARYWTQKKPNIRPDMRYNPNQNVLVFILLTSSSRCTFHLRPLAL